MCSISLIRTTFSWLATSRIVTTRCFPMLLFLILGWHLGYFVGVIGAGVRSSNVLNYPVHSMVQKDQVYSTERHDFLVTACSVFGECSSNITLVKYGRMHSMFP